MKQITFTESDYRQYGEITNALGGILELSENEPTTECVYALISVLYDRAAEYGRSLLNRLEEAEDIQEEEGAE